jgi:O-antigen/teichoic acid export membrane protein
MSAARAQALARNALSGAGRYAVTALLALAVLPFTLEHLGRERFGVWALAGVILPAARLLDLGLHRALVRTVARAKGQAELAAAALATGRGLALALGGGWIVLVWLVSPSLVRWLNVPPHLQAEAVYVLIGTTVVAAIELLFAPSQAALDGLGRMDLSNGVDTVQRILSALGVVLVLSLGWGLPGLVWKNAATTAIAGCAYGWLLHRCAPELGRLRLRLSWKEARALMVFGRYVQTVNLGALLIEPVTKAALSRATGPASVGLYDIAARVVSQVSGAFLALALATFPAAAELHATGRGTDPAAVVALYRAAARYSAWLALPVFGLLIALAGPFVAAWLGPGYAQVAWAIAGLGAGWLVAILSAPAYLVAQASGHERTSTAASLTTATVSIGLAVVMISRLGLAGAVLAVGLGLAAGGVVMLAGFARIFGLGRQTVTVIGGRAPLATALCLPPARALTAVLPAGLAAVLVAGLLGLALYAALLAALGAIGPAERAFARALLRRDPTPSA